ALAAFERSGKVTRKRTTVFDPAMPRYSGVTSSFSLPAGVWGAAFLGCVCLGWASASAGSRKSPIQRAREGSRIFILRNPTPGDVPRIPVLETEDSGSRFQDGRSFRRS